MEEKTNLIFSEAEQMQVKSSVDGLGAWIHERVLEANSKLASKYLYLAVCLIEQWVGGSDSEF